MKELVRFQFVQISYYCCYVFGENKLFSFPISESWLVAFLLQLGSENILNKHDDKLEKYIVPFS
jgi:hypothetical protein